MSEANPLQSKASEDERELALRQATLARLTSQLAAGGAALAGYKRTLETFEARYFRALGPAYRTLDELEAQVAEKAARLDPTDATRQRKAERLRARAEGRPEPAPPEAPIARAAVGEDLKAAYRTLAKLVHPDLAADEEERVRRAALMNLANAAYAAGDATTIASLLVGRSPAEAGDELTRIARHIEVTEQQLAAQAAELAALEASDLARLLRYATRLEQEGRDLFARLRGELEEYQRHVKKRIKALDRRYAKREGPEPS